MSTNAPTSLVVTGAEVARRSGREFKKFKPFNRCAPFNPPLFIFSRDAGEERGEGLNDWNGLNVLNGSSFHRLLKKAHLLRCASIASLQRISKYASARRFLARLASGPF
jgi:hypothetical protein